MGFISVQVLKALDNSLLREIFGPERKDVASGWEKIT